MPVLVECPSCETQLKTAEEKRGKKIRCPKCQEVFQVPAATSAARKSRPMNDDDEESPRTAPAKRSRSRDDDEEDTGFAERPMSSRRSRDDDDDDRDAPRRSRPVRRRDDDDDDYDDEPRARSRKKKGSALPWILAGTGGGVLLLGGAVVAVVLATKKPGADAQAKAPAAALPAVAPAQPQPKPPVGGQPAQPAPAQPAPVNPAQPAPGLQPPQAPLDGAPPPGWKLFVPNDRTFSIWLPDRGGFTGQRSQSRRMFGVSLKINVVVLEAPGGPTFQADSVILSPKLSLSLPAQKRFDDIRDSVRQQVGGNVTSEQPLQLDNAAGREYMISSPQSFCRLRVYSLNNRIYTAMLRGNAQQVQAQEANTFLNSFKLSAPQVAGGNPTQPNPAQPNPNQPRPRRLAAVPPGAENIKFNGDVFAFAQAAVKENRVAETKSVGFTLDKDRYRQTLDEGAVLIGFEVGHGMFTNNVTVNAVRPIFMTKSGEKTGTWVGPAPANPTVVKAKPGYVVSTISVRAGVVMFGFSLTYVKIGKDALESSENYNSDWVGGTFGNPQTVGGQGALVVGVTGHISENGQNKGEPTALGLLVAMPKQ